MVKTIIFSKDRAMQLEATLRSFFMHCRDYKLASYCVIYQASTENFFRQYHTLALDFPEVEFVKEENFHNDLETALLKLYENDDQRKSYRHYSSLFRNRITENDFSRKIGRRLANLRNFNSFFPIPIPGGENHILFMVDDNLFVRPFVLEEIIAALRFTPNAIGFSLRLGRNTTYSYMQDRNQKLPEFEDNGNGVLSYNWTSAQCDFNYPLEVSSSLYRAEQILPLIALIPYKHPNALEEEMAARSRWFSGTFPMLLCFETSVTFCNPINKVQTILPGNRTGENSNYKVEELSELFDRGERVDVSAYDGFCPNSCHQEVKLEFLK